MDGGRYSGGGGCIARYPGTGVGGCFGQISYGMSKVDRIMLKFRPIAPKPVADGSGSSCSTVEHGDGGNRRRKRRYVRANGNRKKKTSNTVSKKLQSSAQRRGRRSGTVSGVRDTMMTLSLMPETPDRKENSPVTSPPSENRNLSPVLLSFNNYQHTDPAVVISPPSLPPQPQTQKMMISVVTVECVTETWMTGDGLGFTDQDRLRNMEMDTCPSFITDSRDTVVWTNKAYREMTVSGGSEESVLVVVKKFNRVTTPVSHPVFTCTVKVTWGVSTPVTITAPCDVWRLGTGGYAWRLDVKAALCLGWYS